MSEGEQPRTPGVRYRRVTRTRGETTVINGIPSTREVPYDSWEPVPPREWDDVILRGVTALAITVTVVAVVGTTASVGGLLAHMVPSPVAYAMGGVFTSVWLACLGVEWLNRISPARARPARIGGRWALVLSMAAVFAYGYTLGQPVAGGVGACIDMLSKGLWALLIGYHAVPLDDGVAHWVAEREQELAGRELLARRLFRLNRRAAYQKAVGGAEFEAATAILASAEQARSLDGPDSAEGTDTADPEPARTVSAQATAPVPPVLDTTRPSVASIVRDALQANPKATFDELYSAVRQFYPDRPTLRDTVRRSALRADPNWKAS
jgi:hypothetical protein